MFFNSPIIKLEFWDFFEKIKKNFRYANYKFFFVKDATDQIKNDKIKNLTLKVIYFQFSSFKYMNFPCKAKFIFVVLTLVYNTTAIRVRSYRTMKKTTVQGGPISSKLFCSKISTILGIFGDIGIFGNM